MLTSPPSLGDRRGGHVHVQRVIVTIRWVTVTIQCTFVTIHGLCALYNALLSLYYRQKKKKIGMPLKREVPHSQHDHLFDRLSCILQWHIKCIVTPTCVYYDLKSVWYYLM
jgi:hypothetical protein